MLTNRLLDIQGQVNKWQRWYADNSGPAVQEFSSLWADDQLTAPYQCSHLIQHYLVVGTDAMDALLSSALLLAGEDGITLTTRPHGQVPLIRTALECASISICLLGDANQNSRITLRLRLAMEDIERQAKTQKLGIKDLKKSGQPSAVTSADVAEQKRRRTQVVKTVSQRLGIPMAALRSQPGMREMVARAGFLSGVGQEHTQYLWNVLAGASHGSQWASQSLLEYNIVDDDPQSEVATVKSTLSPWVLAFLIDETQGLQRHAWQRWEVRAHPVANLVE